MFKVINQEGETLLESQLLSQPHHASMGIPDKGELLRLTTLSDSDTAKDSVKQYIVLHRYFDIDFFPQMANSAQMRSLTIVVRSAYPHEER